MMPSSSSLSRRVSPHIPRMMPQSAPTSSLILSLSRGLSAHASKALHSFIASRDYLWRVKDILPKMFLSVLGNVELKVTYLNLSWNYLSFR